MTQQANNATILALRCGVGGIAICLPLILALGHFFNSNVFMQPSLSHFYYVPVLGDIMVGAMCAVGGFLICYRGYEASDRRVTTLAGVSVIGVALLATENDVGDFALGYTRAIVDVAGPAQTAAIRQGEVIFELSPWFPLLHALFAFVFLLCLGWMSYFEFTKSGSGALTPEKIKRNKVYKWTALIILAAAILLAARYLAFPELEVWDDYALTFWLEAVAIWAFGIAWLIKGEALMADH